MKDIIKKYRKEIEDAEIRPRSIESSEWFEKKIEELTSPIDRRALRSEVLAKQGLMQPHIGRMYLFFYRPEGMFTLPYYDMFPVIIMMKIDRDYFQGLNLHYLPLDLRQEFFLEVLERTNKKVYDKQTYLRIDYDFLNSFRRFRAFKPCFKSYRYKNVLGRITNIPSDDWEVVMNLPTSMFRKAPEELVHAHSRRIYRNN